MLQKLQTQDFSGARGPSQSRVSLPNCVSARGGHISPPTLPPCCLRMRAVSKCSFFCLQLAASCLQWSFFTYSCAWELFYLQSELLLRTPPACYRGLSKVSRTLRGHSRDTFQTLRSSGRPEGPWRHPVGHFFGHSGVTLGWGPGSHL